MNAKEAAKDKWIKSKEHLKELRHRMPECIDVYLKKHNIILI